MARVLNIGGAAEAARDAYPTRLVAVVDGRIALDAGPRHVALAGPGISLLSRTG